MNDFFHSLSNLFKDFIRLLYPNNCIICGESLIASEEHLCLNCLCSLPRTNYLFNEGNPVEKRFWGKLWVEHASAVFFFEKGNVIQTLLHQIKYKSDIDLAAYLGKLMGLDFVDSLSCLGFDVVVPVPLHVNRFKQRGYNQSELLAKGIVEVTGLGLDSNNLKRVIDTKTQTKKTVFERWENTKDVFELADYSLFENKHILLVDDVLTTGSTFEACISALQKTKGIKISVLSFSAAQ